MNDNNAKRITVFRVLLIVVFIVYGVKLFSMQILSGDEYRTMAQDISRRTFPIPAQRGEIYDRNFTRPMVMNRDSFAVSITPAEVPRGSMDGVIETVSQVLNISQDEIRLRLPSQYLQLYQPVEIAANVSFQAIASLAERKNELPGISWQSKQIRNYGDSGSLSHILGYVGDITRDELTTLYNMGYQQGDVIGKAGIEKQYDILLRGKEGRETRTVDVRGRRIAGQENIVRLPPEMGKNLVLTIDTGLQTLVEKALGQRIGAAMVMRPSTGEILAMVSYPWYDPNVFTSGLRSEYQSLVNDPNKPFINRTIQSSYPPASTFKIIMTTGIIAENAFPPEQTVLCPGLINFGNRDWNCHVRRPGHGRLNLHRAMAQSCDIYYWTVGRDYLGAERIVSYSREYGFGELTDIDLPGEIAGFIPTPQWKERRFHERWVAGDTMNMSIGQGYTLVTPIQMANMISMTVNNGKVYKPHVLKEVRDPVTNSVERSVRPELLHESKLSKEVFEAVRRDMRGVITEGTAQYPFSSLERRVQIAGKTGTAEIGLADRWHSWFAAYAPYNSEDAENAIVVSVIVEAANKWEWWAPYASAIIFQGYFANQEYEDAVRTLGFQYLMPVQGRRE
ncbi:MAG: penicillin-binding protein 2 [Treponema sp.]|jgi:penicillin-binding protein 2|nr:penicillin-binding protein 2 [Treponema sp.]